MAGLSFTTTTATVELATNTAGVNAKRVVGATVEIVAIVENASVVGRTEILIDSFSIQDTFDSVVESTNIVNTMQFDTPIFRGISMTLVDNGFTINEEMSVIWTPAPVIDSFTMSDTQELSTTAYLTSIANIVDSFGSIDQTTNLSDTLNVTDTQNIVIVALLVDNFTMSDTQEISTLANLVSNFSMEDILTSQADANAAITSGFTMQDSQALGLAEYLVSTGLFSSSMTDLRTQIELLTDSFTITDVQALSATANESLTGTMQLSEALSFEGSVYNAVLISTLEMGNILWSPDFGAIAWVMNAEGESIVPYSNYDFHSIAEHSGKLFAVSPQGIYELTGDTDNGRKIDAFSRGGFEDFGIPTRKRASDLYVSYTGGMLECGIETYDGPKTVYNYPIEEREANAPRNNRMKVGRGLVSRYWRTEVRNLEGATFKVFEIGLNAVASKRRL